MTDKKKVDLEAVKAKLRKLASMAEQSVESPHEAATAARQMKALMAKHQIEHYDEEGETDQFEFDTTIISDCDFTDSWERVLVFNVARFCECRGFAISVYRGNKWCYNYELKGVAEDVEMAAGMFRSLVAAQEKQLAIFMERYRTMRQGRIRAHDFATRYNGKKKRMMFQHDGEYYPTSSRSARLDFGLGFASGVCEQIREVKPPQQFGALIVLKEKAVMEHFDLKKEKVRTIRRPVSAARRRGQEQGSIASIQPKVE